MNSSVIIWAGLALLLFWSVGAYNRLVRLRSQGLAAFAGMERLLSQFAAMAREQGPDTGALFAAAGQFQASLNVSRSRPLNAPTTKALSTAYETLRRCWLQAPDALPAQWDQLAVQLELARSDFNQSVSGYNAAIGQFPAAVLARLFGLKPAEPL